MQILMGFYVTNGAQLAAENGLELGMFVESFFTQRGISRYHESFLEFKPQLDAMLAERFNSRYTVSFHDPDTQDMADEFSDRVVIFVDAEALSLRIH